MFASSSRQQIVIAGAGPAAWAVGAELSRRGLPVELVAPDVETPFPASYGVFAKAVEGCALEAAVQARFEKPRIFVGREALELSESYLRLNSERLHGLLVGRAKAAGVRVRSGTVTRAEAQSFPGLVIDATGRRSTLSDTTVPEFYQTAYGCWVLLNDRKILPNEMWLMDFRGEEESFLYAIPERVDPKGLVVFLQETVLIGRAPVPMEMLRKRLEARMNRMGLSIEKCWGEEKCLIPLGGGLPEPRGSVVPFGAAANLAHPATGYQLARALRSAPHVAHAIRENWSKGPREAGRAAWECLWGEPQRSSYELFRKGAALLSVLDARDTRQFVQAFFGIPPRSWLGFMEGWLSPKGLTLAMSQVFWAAPFSLRLRLLKNAWRFLQPSSPEPRLSSPQR